MSDLTGKFGSFEDQIASNHTEIMNALDTIATALGAPPSGPTTTLDDVVTALTETNTILSGIRSDMNDQLTAIFNTVDTINNNAALNAQRTLAALAQLYCPCDATAPFLPPPLDTTPTSAEGQAKCRRVQFFTDLFITYITRIANYVNSGAAISGRALNDALQGVLGGQGISTGELATAAIPESVTSTAVDQLANQIIVDGRANVRYGLLGITTLEVTRAIQLALYGATNAADGKIAADAAFATALTGNKYYEIFQTLFYSAWANDTYSDVPVVDDSIYDGTICVTTLPEITECTTYSSTRITADGHEFEAIILPPTSEFYDWAIAGDYQGWTLQIKTGTEGRGVRLVWLDSGGTLHLVPTQAPGADASSLTDHTSGIGIITSDFDGNAFPFTFQICPPGL